MASRTLTNIRHWFRTDWLRIFAAGMVLERGIASHSTLICVTALAIAAAFYCDNTNRRRAELPRL